MPLESLPSLCGIELLDGLLVIHTRDPLPHLLRTHLKLIYLHPNPPTPLPAPHARRLINRRPLVIPSVGHIRIKLPRVEAHAHRAVRIHDPDLPRLRRRRGRGQISIERRRGVSVAGKEGGVGGEGGDVEGEVGVGGNGDGGGGESVGGAAAGEEDELGVGVGPTTAEVEGDDGGEGESGDLDEEAGTEELGEAFRHASSELEVETESGMRRRCDMKLRIW